MKLNKVIQLNISKEKKESIENYCKNRGAKPASYGRMLLLEKVKAEN